ncbi:MAG: IS701 family transposase [Ktedonobacteraceae bacterium]
MKLSQGTIPQETKTTPLDVVRWAQSVVCLHARIASRFGRPEPRRRALAYLKGILSSLERKNGWHLAEYAREATPYGMQRLLSSAVWDVDLVRDDLRTYVLERLGTPNSILVIDETSFPKRGKKSAGVQKQYCGTTGQVENCQVGVFLSYVSEKGHTLIDRELYLPVGWLQDRKRCREAGIPDPIGFQTKCELAQQMIERLYTAHIPISWVVADTVYGSNLDLRIWLELHQYSYGLAVACDEPIGIQTPEGRKQVEARDVEQLLLHADEWQCLSMSQGTKGPRLFDWVKVPILHHWQDDGRHWLLIRRCMDDPLQKTYYLVFGPQDTTLQEMVQAIGTRWRIEEHFETAKDMGLDDYEVRSWRGWYRHVTLVMLAQACLSVICAQEQEAPCAHVSLEVVPQATPLLPLTVPEVRHLLGHVIWPHPQNVMGLLAWSWWRRCHRSIASYYHTKRRLQAG